MPHPHISLVTLGVTDVPRAARFYEALGFKRKMKAAPESEVAFFDAGTVALSLYAVSGLARDAGFAPDTGSSAFRGASLAWNCASEADVDAVMELARQAGATELVTAKKAAWAAITAISPIRMATSGKWRTIPNFHCPPTDAPPFRISRCARAGIPLNVGSMSRTQAPARLPLKDEIVRPTFRRERRAYNNGIWPVAGCDEAGRGPLAGPVVAAAVVLDPNRIPRGLNDSKKLTHAEREKLYGRICATAEVGVAFASPARIDRDNILQASLWALAQAVAALPCRPKLVYVDGRDRIKVPCDCEAVISGDALVLSIAAASIVAKVTRDRLMMQIGAAYPGYGFERHMGYSVPEHFAALQRLGPTIHHRRSFSPVAIADGLKQPPAAEPALGLPL